MQLSHAIILGIVQGLGEFLPISSSAHLVILPWLFHFPDPGLTFDVALHFGTLIALVAYFYKDWWQLTRAFLSSLTKRPSRYNFEERLVWYLVFGTVPAVIAGLLFEEHAETIFRTPILVAVMMAVMGLLLGLADRFGKKTRKIGEITFLDSLLIGISQALAIIPGTSRSGVTITTGLALKIDRVSAARFSFLLSMPIVLGACLLKLKDLMGVPIDFSWLVGVVVSAVVGYLSIKYMLYFLQKYSYWIYVIYRLVFAGVVFFLVYLKS